MTAIALESFDGIQTTDLDERGWIHSGGTVQSASPTARTGSNYWNTGSGSLRRPLGTAEHATIIVGFGIRYTTGQDGGTMLHMRGDNNATTHTQMGIATRNAEIGTVYVYRNGTLLGNTGPGVIPVDTWKYVEMKTVLHDTTGVVQVRVDGTLVIDLQNIDTKNGGTDGVIDNIEFTRPSFTSFYYDDIYIFNGAGATNNNFFNGNARVRSSVPSGNGNTSQLVGSDSNSTDNYALVDEIPPSLTDYVGSSTTGNKDTYAFPDLPDATGVIGAVQISALAAKMDAGAASAALVTRHSATDYDSSDKALTTTPTYVYEVQEVNPGTSAAWTISEVNAAEFGFKVRP